MSNLTITYGAESPNTLIRSSHWNQNVTDIQTWANNNNIDGTTNIAPLGVTTASIANLAVTDAKIAGITSAGKVSGAALTLLGNTPSAAGLLPALNGGVATGMIMMWSGTVATIPSGYVLCDGTNSTPDLRDKFIVGVRQDSAGIAKTNITGALTQSGGSTTITTGNLPASGLSYTVAADNGGTNSTTSFLGRSGSSLGTFTGTTGNMGSGNAYTQPYYALCFVMKT